MHIAAGIALASTLVGLLIGLTGTEGGALLMPMSVIFFHVKSASTISSDLIASLFMRPIAAAVHMKRHTVNYALVGWLSLGSVPMALVGTELRHQMTHNADFDPVTAKLLGLMLITGALVLCTRNIHEKRHEFVTTTPRVPERREESMTEPFTSRPLLSLATGKFVGLCVAMTSIGAGALMIALLVLIYPALGARNLVGTDLAQAVPLTLAAAIGFLLLLHVNFSLSGSIIFGGVPGVAIGAAISSRASTRPIQPLIAIAIFFAGLKVLALNNALLIILIVPVIIALLIFEFKYRREGGKSGDRAPESAGSIYVGSDTCRTINSLSQ